METRRRAIEALNDFLGDIKRRAINPSPYYNAGQSLQSNSLPLPVASGNGYNTGYINQSQSNYGGFNTSSSIDAFSNSGYNVSGATGGSGNGSNRGANVHGPMAQHDHSIPLPNARSKGDLQDIDRFLEQLQATVYENSNSASTAGVAPVPLFPPDVPSVDLSLLKGPFASTVSSDATLQTALLPRTEFQTSQPGEAHSQESLPGVVLGGRATERIDVEGLLDGMTTADSGYNSGARTSCMDLEGDGDLDDDTASVATNGWPSVLPRQDKYLLEAEFARELFNRSSIPSREQFVEHGQAVMELLHSFSVMIGGRASSIAERGAASFVRRGRKYVPSGPIQRQGLSSSESTGLAPCLIQHVMLHIQADHTCIVAY